MSDENDQPPEAEAKAEVEAEIDPETEAEVEVEVDVDADELPDKAKLAQEWQSAIQCTEAENGSPTAPSYEEAMTCSYPVLPSLTLESSVINQQPMIQLQPYSTAVSQPHAGNSSYAAN